MDSLIQFQTCAGGFKNDFLFAVQIWHCHWAFSLKRLFLSKVSADNSKKPGKVNIENESSEWHDQKILHLSGLFAQNQELSEDACGLWGAFDFLSRNACGAPSPPAG